MNIHMILAAALSANAWSQPAPPSEEGLLMDSYQGIRSMAECQDRVGLESSSSFPLPARTTKGVRYRQMFYRTFSPKGENASDQKVLAPRIFAEYDLDGTGLDCALELPMPPSEFGRPIGDWSTAAKRGIKRDAWLKQVRRLLSATQTLGQAFGSARTDGKTIAAAKEFRALFKTLAEPGLAPYYRALSPEFWDWLDGLEAKKKPAK